MLFTHILSPKGWKKYWIYLFFVLILVLKSKFPFSIFGLRPFIKIETSRIVFLIIHNLHMWFFGACPTPGGRGLVGGLMENWEGKTSLGALGGVFEEGGSRPDGCIKFLPSIGPSGASFGVRNMSLDGNDAAKAVGVTRGCIESGGEDVGA